MSDLIDRQAAIDVVMDEFKRIPTNAIRAKTRIESLPSAQLETHEERTETHACDLISRQAALNALAQDEAYDEDIPNRADGVRDAIITVTNLPSSQTERIQNNAVHLCDSCQYTYVTCPSHDNDAIFGDGKSNDNICACNKYRPISAQPIDVQEAYYRGKIDGIKECTARLKKVNEEFANG